jgi:DNA-binding LytR/AlgR family response regulator
MYTRVVTAQKDALIRRTIKELAEEIDPKAFWQIHRSTLVSVKSIAGVDARLPRHKCASRSARRYCP